MVGKLRGEFFPHLFGASASEPLDEDAVRAGFAALAHKIGDTPEAIADGFIRIAVENMANAIKRISVARGYDCRPYVLNCFGGAGGQHACLVADALGMTRIFIHPFSGVLSAYGMKLAALRALRLRPILRPLDFHLVERLRQNADELAREADADIAAQGAVATQTTVMLHVRYEGSDATLAVALASHDDIAREFARTHARLYGFGFEGKPLIVDSIEVEVAAAPAPTPMRIAEPQSTEPAALRYTRFFSQGAWHEARIFQVGALAPGATIGGPALLIEPHQTIVVEPGWQAELTKTRAVILTRTAAQSHTSVHNATKTDPVLLEVFANLFMAIAEEMGATLQNTASSVNIKERLDFPAPSSTPRAGWWRTRRTCPCIWARWAIA